MTGGDSKILTEKAVSACPSQETAPWSERESIEAEGLVSQINEFAEQHITYSVDEEDIKEAASFAFYVKDLDSLRVYKQSVIDGVDIFEVEKYIRMLRKCGYPNAATYFTRGTVGIARSIQGALVNAHGPSLEREFDADNAALVCAYVMAHPKSYGKILRIITEQNVTSYGRIIPMVDGSIAPAITDGVL